MHAGVYVFTAFALVVMWAIAINVPSHQPHINLRLGHHTIQTEVVREHAAMMRGLMHRTYLPRYSGMLFIFNKAKRYCFWTKNVSFPLSIAFLDGQGKVINIEDMDPVSSRRHCAIAPALFALEVNKSIFQTAAITPGRAVLGLPGTPVASEKD